MNTTTTSPVSAAPAPDYASLRQTAMTLLQSWVGGQWTDFNPSDPGITLLENLCYALTDLLYRCGYAIPDLLCRDGQPPYASLYTPARILSTQPVTLLDLRKLVVDVCGVANAWIEPAEPSPQAFYHAGTLPTLPDASEQLIVADGSNGGQPLAVNGPYQVLIQKSATLDLDSTRIVGEVAARLHGARPLGMDFATVRVMDRQPIQVAATIEIGPTGDPNAVCVAILQALADYIAPSIRFYTRSARLAAGVSTDAIFDGPMLTQGFIDSGELLALQRRTALRVSDCIQAVMDVDGVTLVKYMTLAASGQSPQPWSLDLDPALTPLLDLAGSVLTLERKELAVSLDLAAVRNGYLQAQQGAAFRLADPADLDVVTAPGRDRRVANYYPVLRQLPLLYGVGAFGLPPQADAGRRAQARQLQAYLLFFEQLLANEFGQLAHVGDLFGFVGDDPRTYFAAMIDDPALRLDALWQEPDPAARWQRLQQLVENPATAADDPSAQIDWSRKNRFLDHLLARFAEQYSDYAQFEPTAPDTAATPGRLAALKRYWLQSYPALSQGRGIGEDISHPAGARVAGLVGNLRLKLGALNVVSPTPAAWADYPPLPQDGDGAQILLIEHALLRPLDADLAQRPWPLMANARSPDPYSAQISLLFPGDLPRYRDSGFRSFVEKTVSEECPAHLCVYVLWLDTATMAAAAGAYNDWRTAQSAYRQSATDLGAHPSAPRYALSFPLRDARDRLIDVLGLGHTYPLSDVAVAGLQTVAMNETCKIVLPLSQLGVSYALCDSRRTPLSPAIVGIGTGGDLTLATPPIVNDISFTISATKPASGLSLWLQQTVDVKVGLDPTLCASIVDAALLDPTLQNPTPADPRIVDYGGTVQVCVQASQEGVAYQLVDSEGNVLSADGQYPVIGNLDAITLVSQPMQEDTAIHIMATKTFAGVEAKLPLNAALPLCVRANPNLAARAVPPLLSGQVGVVQLADSQSSAKYNLLMRPLLERDYVHAGNGAYANAMVVDGVDVRIAPATLTAGFQPWGGGAMGKDGPLTLGTFSVVKNDILVVVQAVKNHSAPGGRSIPSVVQLAGAVAFLVYPQDAHESGLILGSPTAGSYPLQHGQPGVVYHFRDGASSPDMGLPVYIHKRDETDPSQNMGIGQLVIAIDFAVPAALDPAPSPPVDFATVPPHPPMWTPPAGTIPNVTVSVQAVKAQTGLATVFNLAVPSN